MAQGELLVFVSASLPLNHRAPSSSHASSRSAFSSLPSAFAALSLPVKYSLFPSLQNAQLSSQRKPAAIGTKTGRKETASCLFPDPGIPDQRRTLHHEANLQENRSHNQVLHKERSKATQKSSVPPLTHLSHCVKEKHKSKYTQGALQQQQLRVCVLQGGKGPVTFLAAQQDAALRVQSCRSFHRIMEYPSLSQNRLGLLQFPHFRPAVHSVKSQLRGWIQRKAHLYL